MSLPINLPINLLANPPICVLWLVLLAPPVCAAEVYKWQDEQGRTHYGDRAEGDKAERVQIKTGAATEQDAHLAQRRARRQRLLDIYQQDRQERAAQRQAAAETKASRARRCAEAEATLADIKKASFMYDKTDDPYNPRIYSNAEREQATQQARGRVDKWCQP